MTSARMARRRRTALLTAAALAVVLILVIILVIVGVNNARKKSESTPAPTNNLVLPTVTPKPTEQVTAPASDDPTPSPTENAATPATDGSRTMYVTGDGVNVRKEASSSADKVSALAKGTAVTAYETSGDFIRIKLADGTVGYMAKQYLSETRPSVTSATADATATPDTSKSSIMYVTGDMVNVREGASSSAKVVTRLAKGTKVTAYASVSASGTKWTYIEYAKGKYGYISAQYLAAEAQNTATPTPTPTNSGSATPTPAHATSESDFLPEDVASKVKVGQSRLNQTKVKMAQTLTPPAGYAAIYEVEKLDGNYYYITLKDSPNASYIIYDRYEDIGK